MNLNELINFVDSVAYNLVSTQQKIDWIYELEQNLYMDFLNKFIKIAPKKYTESNMQNQKLMLESQHISLYANYILSKIDYLNRDFNNYNNQVALFNQELDKLKKQCILNCNFIQNNKILV